MWIFYLKNKQPKPNTDIIVIIVVIVAVMLINSTDAMLWCHLPIFITLCAVRLEMEEQKDSMMAEKESWTFWKRSLIIVSYYNFFFSHCSAKAAFLLW